MKIATYNVNSIRQRLSLVLEWITAHKPDVMCLQETKVQDQDFPVDAIRNAGYFVSYRGMKAYNGVATLTRTAPEKVVRRTPRRLSICAFTDRLSDETVEADARNGVRKQRWRRSMYCWQP